jgi:RNA polymerase sigma-70 factor (ECF subfamily)
MHPEDADLIIRCLAGDTEAYGTLVKRYQGAVYATAFYYVGRYGAAEDVAQETFWAAYRNLRSLKEHGKFGPWLRGVATRTAANWLRKNMVRVRQETPLPHRRTLSIEDVRRGPDAVLNAAERYDQVHDAIDVLPDRYRLPVVLRYMQELSYEEIARFTGDTPDEIRAVLHRAVSQLREILSQKATLEVEVPWRRAGK